MPTQEKGIQMCARNTAAHIFVGNGGLVLGFLMATILTTDVRAAGTANIYTGYTNKCDSWQFDPWNPSALPVSQGHYCYHFDEMSPNQWNGSIDQHTGSGSGDANQNTWWIQGGPNWSNVVTVRFDVIPPGGCTGVRAVLVSGLAGSFSYLHIAPTSGLNGTTNQNWTSWPGWIQGDRFLGLTAASQPGCAWYGSHLHQGGNVDWWTDIWRQQPTLVGCGGVLYCWSGPVFKVTW